MSSPPLRSALILGHGSAGRRHTRVLAELGLTVSVVSRRATAESESYATLEEGLCRGNPDYVVISDETARHEESLRCLADSEFKGLVLVEKPLFHRVSRLDALPFRGLYVAYQLRFHRVIAGLRERLAGDRPIAAQFYVGQDLRSWREDRPYTESYSAKADAGGGVLRDLSHEIDLALWLFGPWQSLAALGGNSGALDIDSDDAYAILMKASGCPQITLQLNYLDRPGRRSLVVAAADRTLEADLIAGVLRENGAMVLDASADADPTRRMHEAVLSGGDEALCDAPGGLAVLEVIAAAERSAAAESWVRA